MDKRFEGRDEPVIDPGISIIDAHHHLFDRPSARYLFGEYLADISLGHTILASVYVETLAMARADGPDLLRPIGEVEFANGAAAMSASGNYGPCRVATAIVGMRTSATGTRSRNCWTERSPPPLTGSVGFASSPWSTLATPHGAS
jgi:L-fuconolactonase